MSELLKRDRKSVRNREWLVGVDEAGRGALAGPVCAGAVALPAAFFSGNRWLSKWEAEVNDSKRLSAKKRDSIFESLDELAAVGARWAVAQASVEEIEALNILGATRLAMQRALEDAAAAGGFQLASNAGLGPLFDAESPPVRVIIDGKPLKPFPYSHEALVKGDGKSLAIALASIAAKVSRDRLMARLDSERPGYGFASHKGYGSASHRKAIVERGPCELHRKLFLRKTLGR